MGPVGYTMLGAVFTVLVFALSLSSIFFWRDATYGLTSLGPKDFLANGLQQAGKNTFVVISEEPCTLFLVPAAELNGVWDTKAFADVATHAFGPQKTHFFRIDKTKQEPRLVLVVQNTSDKPSWVFQIRHQPDTEAAEDARDEVQEPSFHGA